MGLLFREPERLWGGFCNAFDLGRYRFAQLFQFRVEALFAFGFLPCLRFCSVTCVLKVDEISLSFGDACYLLDLELAHGLNFRVQLFLSLGALMCGQCGPVLQRL